MWLCRYMIVAGLGREILHIYSRWAYLSEMVQDKWLIGTGWNPLTCTRQGNPFWSSGVQVGLFYWVGSITSQANAADAVWFHRSLICLKRVFSVHTWMQDARDRQNKFLQTGNWTVGCVHRTCKCLTKTKRETWLNLLFSTQDGVTETW